MFSAPPTKHLNSMSYGSGVGLVDTEALFSSLPGISTTSIVTLLARFQEHVVGHCGTGRPMSRPENYFQPRVDQSPPAHTIASSRMRRCVVRALNRWSLSGLRS